MKPLAERVRAKNLDEFVGQEHLVGKSKLLRQMIESDEVSSMIFWGPPGTGKTTLANIIAKRTKSEFEQISAVTAGIKDLKEIIIRAKESLKDGKKTILFIDEIHRWNKKQQDALLGYIEKGIVTLIGATTENPSFEVVGALLSRTRILVFKKIKSSEIVEVLKRALKDKNGLGKKKIGISKDNLSLLSKLANGDLRTALNILDLASFSAKNSKDKKISKDDIKQALQRENLYYDKAGEEHYNIISALHKSMRGSDADAAMYWLCRMLVGGENPLYIARRLIRFASEDIGLANSRALEQTVAVYNACHYIGMPECGVNLAQAVVYLSKCKKSNELYTAYESAMEDVKRFGNLEVPMHIRNAPTKLMKELGYSKGYKYSPNFDYEEDQNYMPEKLKKKKYLK